MMQNNGVYLSLLTDAADFLHEVSDAVELVISGGVVKRCHAVIVKCVHILFIFLHLQQHFHAVEVANSRTLQCKHCCFILT